MKKTTHFAHLLTRKIDYRLANEEEGTVRARNNLSTKDDSRETKDEEEENVTLCELDGPWTMIKQWKELHPPVNNARRAREFVEIKVPLFFVLSYSHFVQQSPIQVLKPPSPVAIVCHGLEGFLNHSTHKLEQYLILSPFKS